MIKTKRIIYICDSGLGDLILCLPWIEYYSRIKDSKIIISSNSYHRDYLELILDKLEFTFMEISEMIDKIKYDKQILEVVSIRSSKNMLNRLKRLSVIYQNKKFIFNPLYEQFFSFFYRKFFGELHYSSVHSHSLNFLFNSLNQRKIFKPSNYIVPSKKKLFTLKNLKKKFLNLNDKYIVIAGSGADNQRKFTEEQINYLSEKIKIQLILIGKDWDINLKQKSNIYNLIDSTSLKEAISLISCSKFTYCIDSVFSHISNAFVFVPSLTIFGNSPSSRWGPLSSQKKSFLLHTNKNGKACRCKACKGLTLEKSCMQELKIIKRSLNILNEKFPELFFE